MIYKRYTVEVNGQVLSVILSILILILDIGFVSTAYQNLILWLRGR